MKFVDFLDFIICGVFGLCILLLYLFKETIKEQKTMEGYRGEIKLKVVKIWFYIFISIMFFLKYFFSFVDTLMTNVF